LCARQYNRAYGAPGPVAPAVRGPRRPLGTRRPRHVDRQAVIYHQPAARAARWRSAAFARSRALCEPMKTYVATPADRQRDWYVIDAEGKTLGRLATQIADTLRGKRKPEYTPHCDTGDFVVVVNAEKIAVTGNKRSDKIYHRHSGYPGGIRSRTLGEMLERRPEEVIRKAVGGMLPRNRLARQQLGKLKVYAGPDHPHAAQKPKPMEIEA
jgi:large subunit ribosomal protein L13